MMRILVATDGSAPSEMAIDLVADTPWPKGSSIHVVRAIDISGAVFGGPWGPMPAVDTGVVDSAGRGLAQEHLDACRERLQRPGIEVDCRVYEGRAGDVIVEAAADWGADLVVVGSRGHGTIESMLLGSVSSEIIDHAPCPVIVARGGGIGRVVLAWDGSACASVAADLLTRWQALFASSAIRVVSVADVVPEWTAVSDGHVEGGVLDDYDAHLLEVRGEHDKLADDMASRLRSVGLDATAERRDGDPATEIVAAAKAWRAELIIVGTHGRSGLRRLLMGSVARNVLHHAACSVLVTRERDEDDS